MVDSIRAGARAEPLGYSTTTSSALRSSASPCRPTVVSTCSSRHATVNRCGAASETNAGAPWSELGGEASWGTVRPAFGDVDDSALGLASFASSVAGYFGDADISRSRWEADPAFIPWLDGLADTVEWRVVVRRQRPGHDGDSAERPRHRRHRRLRAGTRRCRLANASRRNYPAPEMWLQAVLAVPGGAAAPAISPPNSPNCCAGSGWDDAATATTPCRALRRCSPCAPTGTTPHDASRRDPDERST